MAEEDQSSEESFNSQESLAELIEYVQRVRGFDLSAYKRTGLERRIRKRLTALGMTEIAAYLDYLEVHPDEFTHLFNTIMINVTSFFRDELVWQYLGEQVIPQLIQQRPPHSSLRVWSAACASGEEAYSIAMVLAEVLGAEAFRNRVKVYATDIDDDALTKARSACFTQHELRGVPAELRGKYFEAAGEDFCFRKDLRRNVIFGRHDLIQDAPISRIDLLICRNALMYFNSEAQARIIRRLHFALTDHGVLCLGKAEMLMNFTSAFAPVDMKRRLFVKLPSQVDRSRQALGGSPREEAPLFPVNQRYTLRDVALDQDVVAQFAISQTGMLAYANERARELFHLTPQDLGRPLQDLDLSYNPIELRSVFVQTCAEKRQISRKDVPWPNAAGENRWFDIASLPLLDGSGALLGVKFVFADATQLKHLQDDLTEKRQELESALEELQSSNEELETTNEELQSTVEELETTNEELQSTNEELETMNEELRSTNEEMEAINDELRQRSDDLNGANAYLQSIFTGLKFAVVVLNEDLEVQVWSRRAEDMWGLRHEEVVGKNFMSLDFGLPVAQLQTPLNEALGRNAKEHELEINAINRRGKQILYRITVTALLDGFHSAIGIIMLMQEGQRSNCAE